MGVLNCHCCSVFDSRSKSPYSGSSYSRSSYTYSKSRSGSTRSRSYSRSLSRSHSRSYSRSPPYPRRGRGKSRNYRSRSRSHGYHRSRSRSPPYRRYHSRSRSPQAFRGQSPSKRAAPQGEAEREYFSRYREVPPPYDMKAYYGRGVDFRDPFEKERYREWERKYREWYEKYYKGYATGAQPRPPASREGLSPERFLPLAVRNSPFARGRREDCAGQAHRGRGLGGAYAEKLPVRDGHAQKDGAKAKDKEGEGAAGDGKGSRHKKHRRRRRGEEGEGAPHAELLDTARKAREAPSGDDSKADALFVLPGRDDATPVRDEPMDAESVPVRSMSEKDRRDRDKPKAKGDKAKRKSDGSTVSKKENAGKPVRAPQDKLEAEREKSPRPEPPPKKAKEEAPKADGAKPASAQKDDRAAGTPRKAHPKPTKEPPEVRAAKEDKAKREHTKGAKAERPGDRSRPPDGKAERRKRKAEERGTDKDADASSLKASKLEGAEAAKPSPKRKVEPDVEKMDRTPEKDKASASTAPAKKIKLNRETGKKIGSTENVSSATEAPEKPEATASKAKQEKGRGKARRKVAGAEGPGSTLVDYTRYVPGAGGQGSALGSSGLPLTARSAPCSLTRSHAAVRLPRPRLQRKSSGRRGCECAGGGEHCTPSCSQTLSLSPRQSRSVASARGSPPSTSALASRRPVFGNAAPR